MKACIYCRKKEDLRPYGPDGAPICFDCMKASPEREAEAERQLRKRLDAASRHEIIVLGGEDGPEGVDGIA